jgi:hypothetical protein
MKVVTREFIHKPSTFDPRGGAETADHIDIMGNSEMIRNILQIAAGVDDDTVTDRIYSNILEIAENVWENACIVEEWSDVLLTSAGTQMCRKAQQPVHPADQRRMSSSLL